MKEMVMAWISAFTLAVGVLSGVIWTGINLIVRRWEFIVTISPIIGAVGITFILMFVIAFRSIMIAKTLRGQDEDNE